MTQTRPLRDLETEPDSEEIKVVTCAIATESLREHPCQVPSCRMARCAHHKGLYTNTLNEFLLRWALRRPHRREFLHGSLEVSYTGLRRSHSRKADGRIRSLPVCRLRGNKHMCRNPRRAQKVEHSPTWNIFFWSAPKTGPKKLQSQTQPFKMDYCSCSPPNTRARSWIHMQQCIPSDILKMQKPHISRRPSNSDS